MEWEVIVVMILKKSFAVSASVILTVFIALLVLQIVYRRHIEYYSCNSEYLGAIKKGAQLNEVKKYLTKERVKYKSMTVPEYKKTYSVSPALSEGTVTRLTVFHYTDKSVMVPIGCQYDMDFDNKNILIIKHKF